KQPYGEFNTGANAARRYSGYVGMLPFLEQNALFNQISGAQVGNVPWDTGFVPFRTEIPSFHCPSDVDRPRGTNDIGRTNYMFSRGDSAWDHNEWTGNGGRGLRGMFSGQGKHHGFKDITDGLSNTIAMAERTIAQQGLAVLDGGTVTGIGSSFRNSNPSLCSANVVGGKRYAVGTSMGYWGGRRWPDGAPAFSGCTTVPGPNKAQCTQNTWDGEDGIYEPMSRHTGGVQVLFGDGGVHFMPEAIDTGNTTLPPPDAPGQPQGMSPYGVWGSLGSGRGGDTAVVPD
ncbi:MAG: DUF1559 family PulG-like putative transporter, partial [Aureliella sp.]